MSHDLEQLQDVLVDADGPLEQAPVSSTDASAATGGGPSSRVATPVPAPRFVSPVGGLGVMVCDQPPDRTARVRVYVLVCRYPVALQWRELSGFAWPKVSSGRREMAMRERLAALAATRRLTEKGAAHTAAVAGALRRWQVMVSFIQTRPDQWKADISKAGRAAARKQSQNLLPMPGTGKDAKRKAGDLDTDEDDQGDGLVTRDRGAPASAAAAGSAAGGAVPELLDDPLDPVVGPLSTMEERVWLVLQLKANVREGPAHPDGDDDGDGTTQGRGTGQTSSAEKQKRLSVSAREKSVAGPAASKTPGAFVVRDMRNVRLSYAAMILKRSWDVVAAKCGYADAMTMFWPYLVWCAECDNTLSPPHPVGGKASQTVSPGSPVGEYPPRKETPKSTHARRRPGAGATSDIHELCDRKFTCPRRRPRGDTHTSPSYPIRSPRTLGKPSSDTLKGPSENPPQTPSKDPRKTLPSGPTGPITRRTAEGSNTALSRGGGRVIRDTLAAPRGQGRKVT